MSKAVYLNIHSRPNPTTHNQTPPGVLRGDDRTPRNNSIKAGNMSAGHAASMDNHCVRHQVSSDHHQEEVLSSQPITFAFSEELYNFCYELRVATRFTASRNASAWPSSAPLNSVRIIEGVPLHLVSASQPLVLSLPPRPHTPSCLRV